MAEMKQGAALIGDIIGSRDVDNRSALHERLRTVIAEVNADMTPAAPIRITVGDEYQGVFDTVGAALHAALRLRLGLLPAADLRHGIGWGGLAVLQEEPRVEDGPAWWAARAAIEAAEADAARPRTHAVRTRYERAHESDGPEPAAINAALLCRDQLLALGDERSLRLLRGLLAGRTQADLAADEGISASAVSQRTRADGLGVIVAADALLQEV
ncbi:SatD family protein [Pseudactinotalea terrae]|uniref:SatD family protein n=1 Tax=Pseudactinotalea terrae TaxID=1743262 RepID=UPI0019D6A416|nr:SatD family protein [Pseudactinotalea terrae]